MKIKFPKTILIGIDTFKVIKDNKSFSSSFDWGAGELRLGTKAIKTDFGNFFSGLVHEIFEMWTVSLYIRYTRPDNYDDYEFHFDHRLFSVLMENASKTLLEFIDDKK